MSDQSRKVEMQFLASFTIPPDLEEKLRQRVMENIGNNGVPTFKAGGHTFSAHIAVRISTNDCLNWRQGDVTLVFSTSEHTVDENGRSVLPVLEREIERRFLGQIDLPRAALCGM